MKTATMLGSFAGLAIILMGGAMAEPQRQHGGETHRPPPPHPAETHAGPRGYDRVAEPHGWNTRPANFDRGAYQHNFQAARRFSIGAYHRPAGWVARRWAFGQILPRAYFAPSYLIADYWLFALEVPPAGYEWVRDDTDALLVSTDTGEILQVEYDVFA
ncbi:MAG TPA: RcnB family protein [Steroidobacteraceae bacterium]|nr:RcnB family protein [Steroidobacteraceae bacterium]